MKRPVVLFDLDGTLIDSTEAIVESFAYAFESFGRQAPDPDAVAALVGEPLGAMFPKLGGEAERVEAYVEAYKRRYREIFLEKTVLLPHAEEALERAARFARLGVVTTKTGSYSIRLLEHLGLMSFFETLVGSEDVTRHKPHPEPVFEALRRMGASPREAWMVGDTPMDMEAAKAAGARAAAVTCGYAPEERLRDRADLVASNPLFAVLEIEKRESFL
ncbi:HAD family hydrolase [Hydrogenimonas sp.]